MKFFRKIWKKITKFFRKIWKKITKFFKKKWQKKSQKNPIPTHFPQNQIFDFAHKQDKTLGKFLYGFVKNLEKNDKINAYIVGGFLRDMLCKAKIDDLNLIVTGVTHREICKFFPEKQRVPMKFFKKFWLLKVFLTSKIHIDIAIFLDENNFILKENLSERDLSINSLALNLKTWKFFDFFGGFHDIQTQTLRAIHPHFDDDYKKILRTLNFMGKLGFSPDENLRKILQKPLQIDTIRNKIFLREYWKKILISANKVGNILFYTQKLGNFELSPETTTLLNYTKRLLESHKNSLTDDEKFYIFLLLVFIKNDEENFWNILVLSRVASIFSFKNLGFSKNLYFQEKLFFS